jgi:hypothetical protein
MTDANNHRYLVPAIAGGLAGLGLGVAVGVWWGRHVPGHIYRDGDDWYADEPVLRELQRRIRWSGDADHGYEFSLFGHGSIRLIPTEKQRPAQSGTLHAVQSMLHAGQSLERVMLDLVIHRVGTLKLIRYIPRPVPGRMVQGPDIGPADRSAGEAPPGIGE